VRSDEKEEECEDGRLCVAEVGRELDPLAIQQPPF
jgi:hypothetical protein